ncbi:MAG: FAD-dependent oxidoreductase [Thermoplasmata archaeon]|nr:FAD-dependent oxidoreductase [Thermoplasmata archaeon]
MGATSEPGVVVLGAGYAGLTCAHELTRAGRGRIPVTLVDRHPFHVLRTELYEVGRIARDPEHVEAWAVPFSKALDDLAITQEVGEVEAVDLAQRTVRVSGRTIAYRGLAICLGSIPAYYGVPGAETETNQVYRMGGAQRLATELRRIEADSARGPPEGRPRVVVIGGGSTGTEVAAEIATADWASIVGEPAKAPLVRLVTGKVPFLEGLPEGLVRHARRLLGKAGVELIEGKNVQRVARGEAHLEDGTSVPFDVAVWCAGVQAPPLVRNLPAAHGKAGRLLVTEHLELPEWPGVFGVGDVIEFKDPSTGMFVPATAQAALAEAPVAARNAIARLTGTPLKPFRYREKGVIVAVGVGRGAGKVGGVTVWGSPAALIAALQQKEYALRVRHPR